MEDWLYPTTLDRVILAAFASWRIAQLLVLEEGPFDIFERFRRFIGVDVPIKPDGWRGFVQGLFTCVHCMTVWVTVPLVFLPPELILVVAVMGFASALEHVVRRS